MGDEGLEHQACSAADGSDSQILGAHWVHSSELGPLWDRLARRTNTDSLSVARKEFAQLQLAIQFPLRATREPASLRVQVKSIRYRLFPVA